MKKLLRSLPLLAVPFIGLRAKAQVPVEPAFAAALQQKLDSCVNAFDVPGISATILLPGGRFWNGAAGVADIYSLWPMDTAYLFQQASVTKMFVAALTMQLVEEGAIALDDSVGAYLPAITNVPSGTLVRHLLNHRSGLGDFINTPGFANSWFNTPGYVWDPQDVIESFGVPPVAAPNSSFYYSNVNYLLLGLVIEAVTGNPLADELQARFFAPMGLDQTFFPPVLPVDGSVVPGWSSFTTLGQYTDDFTPALNTCYSSMVYGSGALVSRPWDVARFTRRLFNEEVVSGTSLGLMRTCSNVNLGNGCNGYGHGAMRYAFAGKTYFGHAGDINGFTQLTIHHATDSVTLTISINRNFAPRGPIAAALLNVVHQQLSVGIAGLSDAEPGFDLFPVPANDHVQVRTGMGVMRIDLVDAAGRVVQSERPVRQELHRMDLSALHAGIYHVRLITEQGLRTRKLIVQ